MNKHLRKALKKIESGFWQKCYGHFSDGEGNFCILGALTKAYDEMTGEDHYSQGGLHNYDEEERLQPEVAGFYGLVSPLIRLPSSSGVRRSLVGLNDDTDMSLPELAQVIRKYQKSLCIPGPKRVRKAKPKTQDLPAGAVPVLVFLPKVKESV